MILHYKHYHVDENDSAPKQALLILHGLYGQQGNWAAHARVFAEDFEVYALDARNHGQSPHADTMSLREMAADVRETMDRLGLERAHLLGHSMGGKTAMLLALEQPERVASLVVVDIAPVAYPRGDPEVLQGLLALEPAKIASRGEADRQLGEYVASGAVRDFLLTNLQRDGEGGFGWRFNLPALERAFPEIIGWPAVDASYDEATLFIKGGRSDYILPEHQKQTLALFPRAGVKIVEGAGHWVHSEKPETFRKLALRFLLANRGAGAGS